MKKPIPQTFGIFKDLSDPKIFGNVAFWFLVERERDTGCEGAWWDHQDICNMFGYRYRNRGVFL